MSSAAARDNDSAPGSIEDNASNPVKTLALVRTVDNPYSPSVPQLYSWYSALSIKQ
jgi:hypothetical protein